MNFRRLVAPLALAASLAGAGSAHAAPSITTGSAEEGTTLEVPVSAKCGGPARCTYTVQTVDADATGGIDYTPATIKGAARKKQTFTGRLNVAITDDEDEEPAETFIVRVTVKRGASVKTFDATQTITASDEAPKGGGGTTTPKPPSEFPADSGEPTVTTTLRPDGFVQFCQTPFWVGVKGQFGSWGNFQKGCKITIQCPFRVKGCAIWATPTIISEKKVGQKVTMNSRLQTKNTAGKLVSSQDLSCAGTDRCQNDHLTRFDSGAEATVDCNGSRATGPLEDRAQITCGALIQFEDQ